MRTVYEFAEANHCADRFNKDKKLVGNDWISDFCKRHWLSVRNHEQCSLARAHGFNKVQVSRFFNNLKEIYQKIHFAPCRIFNMDESGISFVPNKLPKVISPTGKKNVCKASSGERGQLITVVCCTSVTGVYIPPSIIFPGKK